MYFHSNKEIQSGFYNYDNNLNDIIKTIFPFFGEYFRSINRLSSNPFIIIAAFLFIVFLKKDKIFVNLKYIFFLIIIFNFTSVLKIFDLVLTGTWWIRDFTLIISCLLCLQYFGQIQNHLKIIMIVLLFSYSGLYYVKNFFGIMNNTNNFIVNKPKNLSMINFFKDLNIEEKFNRVYLSPKSFELLNQNNSSKYGIYSEKDLIKFNLSPFNANFKNNKTSLFFKQKNQKQYYTQITPRIDD